MLPTPYDQQHFGRTYLNPQRSSSFESPNQREYQQLHGEDRGFDGNVEWNGSRRRSSEGGGDLDDGGAADQGFGEPRPTPAPLKKSSTVNRSAMACLLCRKQKMKCEGKDKAPCRRCRAAGVECTFEAAAPAPPGARKGGTASKEWIESRMSGVEGRLRKLETHQTSPSASSSTTDPTSPTVSAPSTDALEARIAQLEAQVYALTMAASNNTAVSPAPQPTYTQPQPPPLQQQQQQHFAQSFPSPYAPLQPARSYSLGAPPPPHQQQHIPAPLPSYATFYPTPELNYRESPPQSAEFYAGAAYPPPNGASAAYPPHPMEQGVQQRWGEEDAARSDSQARHQNSTG